MGSHRERYLSAVTSITADIIMLPPNPLEVCNKHQLNDNNYLLATLTVSVGMNVHLHSKQTRKMNALIIYNLLKNSIDILLFRFL